MNLEDKDKKIVDLVQTQFPVDVRPYARIAEQVGMTEVEVIERMAAMKKGRVIRRVGALVNPKKVGYVSSLVAARIDPEKIEAAVGKINAYVGVTHNYHRENAYNVWFTLIAKSSADHARIIETIRGYDGVQALHSLPATKIFKLKVDFKASEEDADEIDG